MRNESTERAGHGHPSPRSRARGTWASRPARSKPCCVGAPLCWSGTVRESARSRARGSRSRRDKRKRFVSLWRSQQQETSESRHAKPFADRPPPDPARALSEHGWGRRPRHCVCMLEWHTSEVSGLVTEPAWRWGMSCRLQDNTRARVASPCEGPPGKLVRARAASSQARAHAPRAGTSRPMPWL